MTARRLGHAEFCRRGHDLRESGSYYDRNDGGRTCRACRLASIAAWKANHDPEQRKPLPETTRAKLSESLKRHHALAKGGDLS